MVVPSANGNLSDVIIVASQGYCERRRWQTPPVTSALQAEIDRVRALLAGAMAPGPPEQNGPGDGSRKQLISVWSPPTAPRK